MAIPLDKRTIFGQPAAMHMRFRRSSIVLLMLVVLSGGTAGCDLSGRGSAGNLRSQSLRTDAVVLPADYTVAVFANDKIAGTSIMLSDAPIDQVVKGEVRNGQIMHIELLWVPKAGETPMDPSATNASIRHIVISNGEVGIYGGAGFARPSSHPATNDRVTFTFRQASLALQESTPGFVDLLSPTRLTGTFTAQKDERRARQLYFATSQFVTSALKRTRYVQGIDQRTTPGETGG